MLRLDGNHVCNVITPTPTFTKATNKGNPNTRSYLLHNYMTYAQILTTLIYFYLHSGYREFPRFIPPTWNSQKKFSFVCLRRDLVTTSTTFEADSVSSLNTSNISDSHILHTSSSFHTLNAHALFFFPSYRILGKNLTKKSGVQSENISINNVPCDP